MAKIINKQGALKPQDLFVLLVILSRGGEFKNYLALWMLTGIAPSALHGAMKRAVASGLAIAKDGGHVLLKPQLREFLLHGAKYAFPPTWSALTRGVPTSYAAAPLNTIIAPSTDAVPVWPSAKGSVRGQGLAPLYPSVPEAALKDEATYAILALFDALRAGQARERNAAKELLEKYFV
jgi:uncharacterized protein GlcG (DUF336 family)